MCPAVCSTELVASLWARSLGGEAGRVCPAVCSMDLVASLWACSLRGRPAVCAQPSAPRSWWPIYGPVPWEGGRPCVPSRLLHGAGGQFMGPSCCVGGSLLNSTEDSTCHLRMRLPLLSLTASLAAPGSHLGAGAPPSSGVSEGLVGSRGSVRKWRVSPSPHSIETAAEDLSFLCMGPGQLEERAEQIRSKSHLIQVEREKMQMELSHKRARVELERAASTSARNYEVGSGGCAPGLAGHGK